MRRILFLNPPFPEKILKDQYCSNSSKADYLWAPIDLITTSGYCAPDDHVTFFDDIADGTSKQESLAKITALSPDLIIMLTSALTWPEDHGMIREIKNSIKTVIVLMGSNVYFNPEKFINLPEVDYIASNFPAPIDAIKSGDGSGPGTKNLFSHFKGKYQVPVPNHAIFLSDRYHHPFFIKKKLWSSVLINHSCPYKCNYCPVQDISFETGDAQRAFEEVKRLDQMGVRQIWIRDLTFSASRNTLDFCKKIIDSKLRLEWTCEDRYDLLDDERLGLMKEAGCILISMGLETVDGKILKEAKRSSSLAKLNDTLKNAHHLSLNTHLYMLLGLPSDSHGSIIRTILYLIKCQATFISINTFVPRDGSVYQKDVEAKYLDSSDAVVSYCKLSAGSLKFYKYLAYALFYLSPHRVMFYLGLIFKNPSLFWQLFSEATSLFLPFFGKWMKKPQSA